MEAHEHYLYYLQPVYIIGLGDMKWHISANFAMAEATICGASAYYECANALTRGNSLMWEDIVYKLLPQ